MPSFFSLEKTMIVNGKDLLELAPIENMIPTKERLHGVSHGLSEAGYDVKIDQSIEFYSFLCFSFYRRDKGWWKLGKFVLASTVEKFNLPDNISGIVHDKSTWARRGLSVFNTVIENGWRGYLTLELVYHGKGYLVIPKGSGIAQVIFHQTSNNTHYNSKYQDQEQGPQEAR